MSQKEIDALLNAISTGEIVAEDIEQEKHKVKTYDFRRPNKFSKDQINTLEMIYESYSRIVSNYLCSGAFQCTNECCIHRTSYL